MADEERRDEDAADRFDGYLDALLGEAGRRPRRSATATRPRWRAWRRSWPPRRPVPDIDPDPAFVEQLRRRMLEADAGIAAVRRRPGPRAGSSGGVRRWRLSRRQALQAGFGAAAGMAAGMVGASCGHARETGDRSAATARS